MMLSGNTYNTVLSLKLHYPGSKQTDQKVTQSGVIWQDGHWNKEHLDQEWMGGIIRMKDDVDDQFELIDCDLTFDKKLAVDTHSDRVSRSGESIQARCGLWKSTRRCG